MKNLLNQKTKRSKSSKLDKNSIGKNLIINIDNSIFNFEDLKGKKKGKILTLNSNKKLKSIKDIEKSEIKYTKANFNSINEISYECKKIINLPLNLFIRNHLNQKLFLRLINYNNKTLFFFGFFENLLIYEIKDNDSIYSIKHFFEEKIAQNITKIILLNEIILSNKILLFFIIKNIGLLYEFDLKDYTSELKRKICFYENDCNHKNYYFKYINNNKLAIYNDNEFTIYNINNNEYKKIDIILKEYEIINSCQKLTNNIFIINTDNKLFIIDSMTDSLLYTIETELHFYWVKILPLKNNQFLLYSSCEIEIYDFDYQFKKESPKFNRNLDIRNLKYIHKVKQITNGDLFIIYGSFNLLVYNLEKNIVKYQIKNSYPKGNYFSTNYDGILEEMEPNIIAFKSNMNKINIINGIKGEFLGSLKEENDLGINSFIIIFKKIKFKSLGNIIPDNNNNIFYLILTRNTAYFLYKK